MEDKLKVPQLNISNRMTTIDRKVSIKVINLQPGQEAIIRIQRRSVTPKQIIHFESNATFEANEEGIINLERDAPISGSYSYVDGMGLFYNLEVRSTELNQNEQYSKLAPQKIYVSLELKNGHILDKKEITRFWKAPEIIQTDIRDQGLVGTFFSAQDKKPRPGIIVLGGSEGGIYEFPAALLASHGFNVLALGYWGVEHLPKRLVEIPLEYIHSAVKWMGMCKEVSEGWLGIHGTSKGGELALLSASHFHDIKAVVSLHGSSISMSGIVPWTTDEYLPPSWIFEGKAVPYATSTNSVEVSMECQRLLRLGENPLQKWYSFLLSDPMITEKAIIPLEKIKGSILMISGDSDAIYNSVAINELGINRLKEKNFPFSYEHLVYKGAGHEAGIPNINLKADKFSGGNKKDIASASRDSWYKTIKFFEQNYKSRKL